MKLLRTLILLLVSCTWIASASAQTEDLSRMDFSKVRIDDLSDSQLADILRRADREGINFNELEKIALARGMRPSEVVKFRGRARDIRSKLDAGEFDDNADRRRQTARRSRDGASENELRRERRRGSGRDGEDDDDLFDSFSDSDRDRRSFDRDSIELDLYAELDSLRKKIRDLEKAKIFGEDLFASDALTFEPSLDIPTPENYQIGPGDEVVIDVWGSAEMTYEVPVGRDGTVRIDGVGPITVSGLTIKEAERRILDRLSGIYAGLNSPQPSERNVYADVSLGKIRTIKVHILGEVIYPGSYSLPATATVLNGLYVCSGPNKHGSYRSIQVIRGEGVIAEMDVYEFLVHGRLDNNIHLRDQDIIKVDPYLARVEIKGEVKRPALYEIKPGERVADLLRFSGWFTGDAYTKRLKLYRTTDVEKRIVSVAQTEFDAFDLRSGDEVFVDPVLKRFENRVEIRGAVYRRGDYQLEDAPTLYALIERAEGLRGDAFRPRGQIYRTREDFSLEVIAFDLGNVMTDPEQYDVPLRKNDAVVIPSIFDLKEERMIEVQGAVQEQGAYPYMDGMTLRDVLVLAGGLKEEASLERAEVSRRRTGAEAERGQVAEIHYFDIDRDFSLEPEGAAFVLEPFDEIFIRRSPNYYEQRNVHLSGEVTYPGTYTIKSKDDRVSSIIARAGGLTPDAYPRGARLNRSTDEMGAVGINLERILSQPGSEFDLLVEKDDSIHVPLRLEIVKVSGAVHYPVSVRFSGRLGLMDYVNSAGGPTDQADMKKAYVVNANGSVDRVNRGLLFHRYPKIEPGAEVVIPTERERERMSAQERTLVLSSIVSIAAVVSTTIFQLTR